MDIYSHIIQGMEAEAIVRLGDILPQGEAFGKFRRHFVASSGHNVTVQLIFSFRGVAQFG